MRKSVLITGCSSGIGLQVATDLHHLGLQVFASCRQQKDVTKLKSMGLNSILLDVTDPKSIDSALDNILTQTSGTLDVLFNNAGYGQIGAVEDLSKTAIFEQFNTNVFGLLELTNRIIPIMREQGSGKIIATSSVLGFIAMRYRGAYVASKFALEGLFDTLRLELKHSPISVSLIEPGPIESRFRANATNIFQSHINPQTSAHYVQYLNMQKHYQSDAASKKRDIFTLSPAAVTNKVLKIIASDKPKARYSVTFPTYLFHILVRILPVSVLDKILYNITEAEVN